MDLFQRDQFDPPVLMLQCRCLILVGNRAESLCNLCRVFSRFQADIGINAMDVPDILPLLWNSSVRKQEVIMQMRVGRHIGNHTGHFEMLFCRGGTESQNLSQRLRAAEITVRGTRCQHHSVRSNQLPFPLPFQDREIEQLEE